MNCVASSAERPIGSHAPAASRKKRRLNPTPHEPVRASNIFNDGGQSVIPPAYVDGCFIQMQMMRLLVATGMQPAPHGMSQLLGTVPPPNSAIATQFSSAPTFRTNVVPNYTLPNSLRGIAGIASWVHTAVRGLNAMDMGKLLTSMDQLRAMETSSSSQSTNTAQMEAEKLRILALCLVGNSSSDDSVQKDCMSLLKPVITTPEEFLSPTAFHWLRNLLVCPEHKECAEVWKRLRNRQRSLNSKRDAVSGNLLARICQTLLSFELVRDTSELAKKQRVYLESAISSWPMSFFDAVALVTKFVHERSAAYGPLLPWLQDLAVPATESDNAGACAATRTATIGLVGTNTTATVADSASASNVTLDDDAAAAVVAAECKRNDAVDDADMHDSTAVQDSDDAKRASDSDHHGDVGIGVGTRTTDSTDGGFNRVVAAPALAPAALEDDGAVVMELQDQEEQADTFLVHDEPDDMLALENEQVLEEEEDDDDDDDSSVPSQNASGSRQQQPVVLAERKLTTKEKEHMKRRTENREKTFKQRPCALAGGKLTIPVRHSIMSAYTIFEQACGRNDGSVRCWDRENSGTNPGESTVGSFQQIVNTLIRLCALNKRSSFLDAGSGRGYPTLHVNLATGASAMGIEVEELTYGMAIAGTAKLQRINNDLRSDGASECELYDSRISYVCGNLEEVQTFDPFSHLYLFSEGYTRQTLNHVSITWNESKAPYMIAHHDMPAEFNLNAEELGRTKTRMKLSGETHTCRYFRRIDPAFKDMIAKRDVDAMLECMTG